MFERKAFYSPQEVAELAGLSNSTILNYIRSGRLYAVKLSERTYRIPLGAVIATFYPEQRRPPKVIYGTNARATVERWEREWRAEHGGSRRRAVRPKLGGRRKKSAVRA